MAQHLRLPLEVSPTGRLATNVADSPADVAQSLAVLAGTAVGERLSVPRYGVPPLLFGSELPVDALRRAAGVWEPRASGYDVRVEGPLEDPQVTLAGVIA